MEVIKNNAEAVETAKKNDVVTQRQVDEVETEYKATKADNKKKVYGVELSAETRQDILDYMTNDVEWSFMEAVGIPKIVSVVEKEEIKNGSMYLPGLELEALAFYLSKFRGKGLADAKRFLAMNEAINEAYGLRAEDNKVENTLKQKLDYLKGALAQGLAAEAEAEENKATAKSEIKSE